MRLEPKRTFVVSALLAGLALMATPSFVATAVAADAQLYELTENMKLVGGKLVHRKATSQLMGTARAGTPLCPALVDCTVNATGSDNISVATGLGTFGGTFTVVVHGDNATDSPEFVVAKGRFSGKMDFSLAILSRVPLGHVVGKMVLDGAGGTVPFSGTFRLPFILSQDPGGDAALAALFGWGPLPLTPFPTKFYAGQTMGGAPICTTPVPTDSCSRPLYLDDDFTTAIPVTAEEYGLGYPGVRFDITF